MLYYIMRLDDATPTMNKDAWLKIENILDKYNIKPIVGIIPESEDSLFNWDYDNEFWDVTVQRWIKKGWVIAQHGYHHVYHDCINGGHSEYVDLNYEEQMELIQKGYDALKSHNVEPSCFFAPGHTFDDITVDVCRDSGYFQFISDGEAIWPYKENGMLFIPSVFDTPHKLLPFGVYTFIMHPNFTTEDGLELFESFFEKNAEHFISVPEILSKTNINREKNIIEKQIKPAINLARKIRKSLNKA